MDREEVIKRMDAAAAGSRKYELRYLPVELRADGEGEGASAATFKGHASMFDIEADLGFFVEVVRPGAFRETILNDDIRALFNHDDNIVLGRNTAGTLHLSEDGVGLLFDINPPNTTWGRDLRESVKRRDITQCSIGFNVLHQNVSEKDGIWHREITKVKLWDVSIVTFPAFVQTDVALRSAERAFNEFRRGPEDKRIADAAAAADEQWKLIELELRQRELDLVRTTL